MRSALIGMLAALILSIGLGLAAQRQPAAARAVDEIRPASAAWYTALPRDPDHATAAYLARVPAVMRERGEAVSRSRYWALGARIVAGIGALLLFLYGGAASALEGAVSRVSRHRPLQALLFALALLAFLFVTTLPVEVAASYVRYRWFGFSDQPFFGWLADYSVGWASTAVLYAIGIMVTMGMIRRRPRTWFWGAGLVYLVLAIAYTVSLPLAVEPLTNSFTPLPASPMKQAIIAMAKVVGVPADNVYASDASRQSRRLNGHVSGLFGTARIVIDDTAIASTPEDVEAIAAHEMGHYVMHHELKTVIFVSLVMTFGFALIAWWLPALVRVGGLRWGIASPGQTASIAVFWLLFNAWGFVAAPIANAFEREKEAQADDFGLDLSRAPSGMADFLIRDADIARLDPTPLDVLLFYDHPSDAARIRNAMAWRAAHLADDRSPPRR